MHDAPSPHTPTREELSAEVTRLKNWQNRGEYAESLAAERGVQIAKLRAALTTIAAYDKDSKHGTGICPYGCDCPNIAQQALKT